MTALVPALDLNRDPREFDEMPAAANIEAEQALLGCVLFDNEAFHQIEGLEPRHFFEPFHARLYEAMGQHIGKGQLAEPIVLMERFKRDPAFEELGGLRYLADLVDRAPPASQVQHYAQLVSETSIRRTIVKIAGELTLDAKGLGDRGLMTAVDLIGEAEAALLGLQIHGRETKMITAAGAAARVLEQLDAPKEHRAGLHTGLAPLDRMLGPLLPGDLVLLMGRPSMGKSAFAECLALNIANPTWAGADDLEDSAFARAWQPQPAGAIQINGEMSPEQMARRHLTDIAAQFYGSAGPKYSDLRKGEVTVDQRRMLGKARDTLEPMPLTMLKRPGMKLSALRSVVRRQTAEWSRAGTPLGAVIVDHVGLLKPDQRGMDRYEAQTEISNGLKELADELQCVIFGLNQMNRENERREDKRPQLSDLRDSGSWEQDADFVIGFYREAYYAQREPEPKDNTGAQLKWDDWDRRRKSRTIEAIVLKAREGECGTAELWGDVARNAIRGSAPETDGGFL